MREAHLLVEGRLVLEVRLHVLKEPLNWVQLR